MKTQNKNNQTAKSAEKRGRPIRGLVSHLIGWESSASFLDQSQGEAQKEKKKNAKPIQSRIAFDTQLKIALL